jgi:presenilin-like A22 family membrane protease
MVPRRANVAESTYLSVVFTNAFEGFKVLSITLRRKRVLSLLYLLIVSIVSFTQYALNNNLAPVIPTSTPVNRTLIMG